MSAGATTDRRILVAVDFSEHSRAAVDRAKELARQSGRGLELLHALYLPPLVAGDAMLPVGFWEDLRGGAEKELEQVRGEVEAEGIAVETRLVEREPVDAILQATDDPKIDLVVMGTHGHRGIERFLLGSVAERTVRRSPVSVLVVHLPEGEAPRSIRKILFATDHSESSERAEQELGDWASRLGAGVEVVHALRQSNVMYAPYSVPIPIDFDGKMRAMAEENMAGVVERLKKRGVDASAKVILGEPVYEVPSRAAAIGADLLVMAARGHSTLERFLLGSVAEGILRRAPCSVLVLRGRSEVDR